MGSYSQGPLDIECYKNYFLVKTLDPVSQLFTDFEMFPGQCINALALRMHLATRTIYTFNGNNYDVPMLAAFLHECNLNGAPHDYATSRDLCLKMKAYNDAIIVGRLRSWTFYKQFGIEELTWLKHVDVIEVAPGVKIGLKMYMGRMHSHTLQDLPIDPAGEVLPEQRAPMRMYCGNDLRGTWELVQVCEAKGRLPLRRQIGEQYGIDVMSKSDAQIAESVIKAELPFKPQKVTYPHGYQFHYEAPAFIRFETEQMQRLLATILTTPFTVNDVDQLKTNDDDVVYDIDGNKVKTGIIIPPEIAGTDIRIGNSCYRVGIGGLHSSEKSVWYQTIPGMWSIDDFDVGSYYPSLILLMNMFPKAIGEAFVAIYRKIYTQRLDAKRKSGECRKAGDKAGAAHWKSVADGLKITLNGAFGKLGSKYSILFAPELLIRTTITGQLALLMLIEALEVRGIPVVSANTDGIILKTPAGMEAFRDSVIKWWEQETGLEMEQTPYTAIFNRDVNNYIAFKPDGTHKAKGCFGEAGISPDASPSGKHPDNEICADAVIAYLGHGTPLFTTIRNCQDIRKFVTVQQVTGGAVYERTGEYLGKAVRWYHAKGSTHCLRYAKPRQGQTIGNKVPSTDGVVPCMTLPDVFPSDIDYSYYEREAYRMLLDLGVLTARK